MEHKHSVYDTDTHFVIEKDTREIKSEAKNLPVIVQHDHNSERFSFRLEKLIDGHDMTQCNQIKVHYINIDSSTKETAKGVYEVDDIRLLDGDESKAVCSWLISENATQYAGKLNFKIEFACVADDGTVTYRWNTAIYSDVTVSNGMDNGEVVTEAFPDILAQWEAELFGIGDTVQQQIIDKGEEVKASIPADYTALTKQADNNERSKAPAIVLKAEGESVVVNDASNCYLHGLRIFGKSTQAGTPSPDNPQEIHSVENAAVTICGKNLFDGKLEIGTINANGGALYYLETESRTANYIPVIPGVPIYIKREDATGAIKPRFYDREFNYLGTGTGNLNLLLGYSEANPMNDGTAECCISITNEAIAYMKICVESVNIENHYMVSMVDAEYEESNGNQTALLTHILNGVPVTSGGNYTDANGQQWICDEVDFERGVYVQRVFKYTYNGTESWTKHANTDDTNFVAYCGVRVPNVISHTASLCDRFAYSAKLTANTFFIYVESSGNGTFHVSIPIELLDNATTTSLKAWLAVNPVTLFVPMSVTIETPLSDVEIVAFKALHTNKPNTAVLNDSGAYMAVEYVADTKTYIDNKIAELMAN